MTLTSVFALLAAHYVGDFLFQPEWLRRFRENEVAGLAFHSAIVTLCLVVSMSLLQCPRADLCALIIGFFHFTVDSITGPSVRRFRDGNRWYPMFVVLGANQLVNVGLMFFWYDIFRLYVEY